MIRCAMASVRDPRHAVVTPRLPEYPNDVAPADRRNYDLLDANGIAQMHQVVQDVIARVHPILCLTTQGKLPTWGVTLSSYNLRDGTGSNGVGRKKKKRNIGAFAMLARHRHGRCKRDISEWRTTEYYGIHNCIENKRALAGQY
ncbi:hypothetical protein BC826DRAFT_1016991 [Russula brevipes]|nr:hypothetical protein BC826DRAFT_1016991 [Russula brevipes]